MQLVHAFDMQNMSMVTHHDMSNMKHSIFCETSSKSKDTQCAKEIIPDKLLIQQNNDEIIQAFAFVLPISFASKYSVSENTRISNDPNDPLDIFLQKNKYVNLIGIIKNVN